MNRFLYATVVLIWGSTWLAISLQADQVAPLAAVFYRFLPATAFLLIFTLIKGELRTVSRRDLFFALLQGLCLYSLNYLCFYKAAAHITGGMEALVFSTTIFFNTLGSRLIWKQPVPKNYFPAVLCGLAGLFFILFGDLSINPDGFRGILLCLAGTMLFAVGNMIGIRQHRAGLSPLLSGTYAMGGGTGVLLLLMLVGQTSFQIPLTGSFLIPLFYLALPGTVVAFTCYLTLVNRLGASKAGFITVMTPFIACLLSFLFEGETFSLLKAGGGLLIIGSNILIMRAK
ncbi:MAG: DMT family transporter [Spirochaetales bacterium]|nr:DMT family transporter [Spirochaetales bacterium]